MKRALMLAATAFLVATPISLAQTAPQPQPQPAAPTASAPVTTPAPSATPAAPAASAAPTATPASETSSAAPQGCRTHKAAGESCACLSDTSRVGTSTAHPDGYNVCVRPS